MANECIEYWKDLTSNIIAKDEEIEDSVFSFHASQNNTQLRYGLTNELFIYLMELLER